MRKQTLILYLPYGCAAFLGTIAALAPRVLYPEDTRRLAVCLFFIGILSLMARYRTSVSLLRQCSLADAMAFMLAGIAIFPRYRYIRTVFPIVTGAMFMTQGLTALLVSRYLGQCGNRKWLRYAILSFMIIAAAVYLLLVLFRKADPAIRTVGVVMLGTAVLKLFLCRMIIHL